MYNFNNLSDVEFEILCKDIMQRRLGIELHTFAKGRDGGIDIVDNSVTKNIVIQVKHYIKSSYANLRTSLKNEIEKVEKLCPKQYYVCCAQELTAGNKNEIYSMFSKYMKNVNDIISLQDINDFLEKAENMDIVKKHYKLWLESTNILGEIFNQNIFIDCESLLYNIENESKEFVETNCYRECKRILEKKRMILLLGMPGTGKTVTTKMLALYYAANGYRIRYTTNGDLNDIKKALSSNKNLPEIVLLDDCFGQHYFKMKESQGNELLSLVKYIALNKNKKLIMNSRVTIYQQAKEDSIEFRKFAEDKQFEIRILDMKKLSIEDKGKIFYNQIFFKKLPSQYYQNILKNKNYKMIVTHQNYTPRIMEFVTRAVNYNKIKDSDYAEYIIDCLENPFEIWQDEFSNKLQQEDRIFMTTLYSLTDTSIGLGRLKKVYNYRLKNTMTVDTTRNIWEEVLLRLNGAFIVIIEKYGKKEIGVINPSVNDFLKSYLEDNDIECESIKKYAIDYEQVKRGFAGEMEEIVCKGDAILYNYSSDYEEINVILNYICNMKIKNEKYRCIVEKFYKGLAHYTSNKTINSPFLFIELFTGELAEFYNTQEFINEEKILALLWNMNLDEYKKFINLSFEKEIVIWYEKYKNIFIKALNDAIIDHIQFIDIYDYCDSYDIDQLIEEYTEGTRYHKEIDIYEIIEILYNWVNEDIENKINSELCNLPEDIIKEIKIEPHKYLNREEIEAYVSNYIEPEPDYEDDDYFKEWQGESAKILDYIFK